MKKVITIIGTRPEAIKTVLLHKLLMNNDLFEPYLLCTGQHDEMVDEVLEIFGVEADVQLLIPDTVQTLNSKCAFIISALEGKIKNIGPDLIIVQGDTLSSFCGAIAAFFNKIQLIHLEAGLRTKNKWGPYPEEILRQLNDNLADILFAPSQNAYQNLIAEGIQANKIIVTGNTGIDALKDISEKITLGLIKASESIRSKVEIIKSSGRRLVLLTLHRRESLDHFIENYLNPIDQVAEQLGITILYPVHPNPLLKSSLDKNSFKHIEIINPLNYIDFVSLMQSSCLFFTDSGGIQEEAVYLGKPVIILRNETERPEAVTLGYSQIIDLNNLNLQVSQALKNQGLSSSNIYGDGRSSEIIIEHLIRLYGRD